MGRTLSAVVVAADVEDPDGALVAHPLLGDAHHLLVVVREGDPLDGRRELPHEEALARLYGPQPHLVIRRARDEETRLRYREISKTRLGKKELWPREEGGKHAQSTSIVQTVPLCPL